MSVAKNPITGDSIQTKEITEKYRLNYDLIFNKKAIREEHKIIIIEDKDGD